MPATNWQRYYDRFLVALDAVGSFLIKVGLVLGLLSFGYLLYAWFSGAAPHLHDPGRFTPAKQTQVVQTIQSVGLLFIASAVTLSFFSLIRNPDDQDVLILNGLAALVFWLGLPFFMALQVRGSPGLGPNAATDAISGAFVHVGRIIAGMLALLAIRGAVRWVRFRPLAAPDSVTTRKPAPELARVQGRAPHCFSPCWHLPYCQDFLLKICPAFQAKKKCWKLGRGCYCDQSMIDNLVRGAKAIGRQRGQSYVRREIAERLGVAQSKGQQRKPPCGRCFIYLEHQRLKHRFLSPLMYPLALGLTLAGMPLIRHGYAFCAAKTAHIWRQLSLGSDVATPGLGRPPTDLTSQFDTALGDYSIYLVIVIVGFVLLVALLKLSETAIFKWKW